ncbi:hypothetical protein ARMSODRAFT_980745 [Armillaria solidipes]|uniref:Uncharacterized protein n=1 Tax=Armillaria solidipes TaxID=1076256 RepID=A0A2H3AUS6_9AGAR|nr:hypothetical protein ARMSODRAFT_980745 [Armillaria solidipes]
MDPIVDLLNITGCDVNNLLEEDVPQLPRGYRLEEKSVVRGDYSVTFTRQCLSGPGQVQDGLEIKFAVDPLEPDIAVVPSHAPPVHPFDSHRHVFSFLIDEPYTPGEATKDAPTLGAREWGRWFLLTLFGKPRYDDRKASEERNILWRLVHHGPRTEPDDWEDLMRSRRDDRTQHQRWANQLHIQQYAAVSPSGLTATTPSQSHPPPQTHHELQAYPSASPTPVLLAGCHGSFGPQLMGLP